MLFIWKYLAKLDYNIFFSFLYPELAQLTGVAAILRFPMPELEDSDDDDDEDGAAGGNDSDSD